MSLATQPAKKSGASSPSSLSCRRRGRKTLTSRADFSTFEFNNHKLFFWGFFAHGLISVCFLCQVASPLQSFLHPLFIRPSHHLQTLRHLKTPAAKAASQADPRLTFDLSLVLGSNAEINHFTSAGICVCGRLFEMCCVCGIRSGRLVKLANMGSFE